MEGRDGDGGGGAGVDAGHNTPWWYSATTPQPSSSQTPDNNSFQQNHTVHPNPFMENFTWSNQFPLNAHAPYSQPPPENSSSHQNQTTYRNPWSENNMSQNFTWSNQYPPLQNRIPANHIVPENYLQNLRYPFYQNPTQQNDFLENPNPQNPTTQNPPNDVSNPMYPYESFCANPSFESQNLENNSSQLNQSAPSRQYQFPGFSEPYGNQQIAVLQSRLERLRIETVAKGFNDLGLPHGYSVAFSNNQYRNRQQHNGRNNLTGAENDGFFMHNGNYSARRNGIRFGLGSSINGLQSSNASVTSSYRYNNSGDFHPHYSSMEEVRGRIATVAKEQSGCRFLQKKIDERNPRDIETILSELIKEELHELILHQVANYLIQKIIGVLNDEQMTKLILSVVGSQHRFFRICDDLNGSRVMQKLLDVDEYQGRRPLTPDQNSLLVTALKDITLTLSKSVHGYHVIERCLQKFPYQYSRIIVEEIADNCVNLATDKSGCCLLQHCILHAQDQQKGRLIADIVANALFLSEDSYGNYVVQYILGLKIPQVTNDITAQLAGNYFTLSQGKCSSNVVEKCLRECGEEQSNAIINELIRHPKVLELMLHSYGNYVIQSAWMVSEGRRIQQSISNIVQTNVPFLQSHIYGKRVLATVRGNRNRVYRSRSL